MRGGIGKILGLFGNIFWGSFKAEFWEMLGGQMKSIVSL